MEAYLNTFLIEKGIDLENVIFEIEEDGGMNYIPLEVVIEHIITAPKQEQLRIKKMLVKVDFVGGDILNYFEFLAKIITRG